ncbi:phage scaffolding protein [Desulfotomaculum sp. 1211_IL3151]|uniref:phage scaffolding protein n=1 Tax=Desulfotomaculum sp. 1211_IL3151 TaxID=3084055 RepID=UPI002FDA8259
MTKEELIALGLTDELATKAAAASAEELKSFIPKTRFDEVNEAKKQAEKDRDTVSGQLEELKKTAGVSEDLKKQIETLQGENKAAKEKHEADMKALTLTNAIKLALTGKAHDPDIVTNLLDKAKIELNEDGTIKSGLDDQIKALRESKAFLFADEKKDDNGFQFKGFRPAEGSDDKGKGGEGDKEGAFGKRLADFAKSNEGLEKARQSYFE